MDGSASFDEHIVFLVILCLKVSKGAELDATSVPVCKTWIFQVDLPVTDRLPFNIFVLATTHVPQANPKLALMSPLCDGFVGLTWCRFPFQGFSTF